MQRGGEGEDAANFESKGTMGMDIMGMGMGMAWVWMGGAWVDRVWVVGVRHGYGWVGGWAGMGMGGYGWVGTDGNDGNNGMGRRGLVG